MWAKLTQKILLVVGVLFALLGQTASASIITTPNHFVDSQWNLNSRAGYDSIEVDIKPEIEESTTTDGYYFANTVYFSSYTGSNFGGAYAGLQTNGYDGTNWIGKMLIFSAWDVASGLAETGGTGLSFGGEGTGYSVRLAYNWNVGTTYRLKIYIDQNQASGDRLWAASVTDQTTGSTTRIGRIYIPVARGKIRNPTTFHELYLSPASTCSAVKKSQVAFTNMSANNSSVKATSWSHYSIGQTPQCPNIAWLNDLTNGYQSGVATTKPAPLPTPIVPTIPKTAASVPKVTPVAPKTEAQPITPTITPTPTLQNATTQPSATTVVAAPAKQNRTPWILVTILAVLSIASLVVAASLAHQHVQKRRFIKHINKHFPYDPDIRRT